MKKFFLAILAAMMIVMSAGFVFAHVEVNQETGDIGIDNTNTNNQNQNVTANPTASVSGVTSTSGATGGTVSDSGNSKAAVNGSGNSNVRISQSREFLGAPAATSSFNFVLPPDANRHHRTAQAPEQGYGNFEQEFTQESYNNMIGFLDQAHSMDSNTRTWEELREDLVIQPRADHPRKPLADNVPVRLVSVDSLKNVTPKQIVGYITVRDKNPVENSVDAMYFVQAIYPYAKLMGANTLVRIDSYFWSKVKAGSWGAGIGGALSHIFNCFTGGAGSLNAGFSQGNASEYVAGGEMYLALYVPDCPPCPVVAPPCPPVVKPEPAPQPKCEAGMIEKLLREIERYREAAKECPTNCWNNEKLWKAIADNNMRLFYCTGNRKYLLAALYAYERAEKNYLMGVEPSKKATRTLKGATDVVKEIRHNWSLAILWSNNNDQRIQDAFLEKYGIESAPENINDLW